MAQVSGKTPFVLRLVREPAPFPPKPRTPKSMVRGLPRWSSGKESACQRRRRWRLGFNSWLGRIPRSRKWQLTPVFLPGKFHEQRNLVGYSPWGCKKVGHDLMTKQQQTLLYLNKSVALSLHTCQHPHLVKKNLIPYSNALKAILRT